MSYIEETKYQIRFGFLESHPNFVNFWPTIFKKIFPIIFSIFFSKKKKNKWSLLKEMSSIQIQPIQRSL